MAPEIESPRLSRLLPGLSVLFLALALAIIVIPQHAQAGGSGVYPPPANGDWVITTDTVVFNQNVNINGNVVVQSGKDLRLDHVTLSINSTVASKFRVEVLAKGSMEVQNSTITAVNRSLPHYIVVRKDGKLDVLNSTLECMGTQEASFSDQYGMAVYSSNVTITGSVIKDSWAGIYIENATPTISGDNFTGDYRGIYVYLSDQLNVTGTTFYNDGTGIFGQNSTIFVQGCKFQNSDYMGIMLMYSNADIEGTTIKASTLYSLEAWGSSVFMANGSLDGGRRDLYLDRNSNVVAFNVSMNIQKLDIEDEKSHITVFFIVDVKVVWWSNTHPVNGAFVRIMGPDGLELANGTTAANGLLPGIWVPGFDLGYRGLVFHSPINLTAKASGLKGNITVELKRSGQVNITIDDLRPGLNVTAPRPGSYYNRTALTIQGLLWDNESGPARVEVSVDGANYTAAQGIDIWNFTVNVKDGRHNVTVKGYDVAGNNVTVKLNLTVDTVAPAVSIKGPKNGLRIRATFVWANGTVEMGANLTINGRHINATNGNWGLYVNLVEGPNNITAVATDWAGNIGRALIIVTRDTMVDPLKVDPVNGTQTNMANFTLKGTTEPGATLRATWDLVVGSGNNTTVIHRNATAVADSKGSFVLRLQLNEGLNNFTLFAKDVLNNTRYMNLTYKLDSVPPLLRVTSPKEEPYYTNKNGVNIKGYTEAGARVFLNGQELQLYDLQFTIRVEVFDGLNNFSVKAMDQAGNTFYHNFTVIVDKRPPSLVVTRPKDAETKTYDAYYTVIGNAENGSTVSINGEYYPVTFGGNFKAKRSLAFGRNELVITARDRAGNINSTVRIIIREKSPPNKVMSYIGYVIPLVALALIIGLVLFYMYGTGRLQGLRDRMASRKDAKDKDKLARSDDTEEPPKQEKEPEAPISIPGASEGPSYDDEPKGETPKADDDVQEMEELDDKEGKD